MSPAAPTSESIRTSVKRRAIDDDYSDQRLSKRFDLLNLEHNGKLYIAKPNDGQAGVETGSSKAVDDYMQVEETKDKIFIHNLDEELDDEDTPEEERLIFLPDIEKHLHAIPKHLLTGPPKDPKQENQLVLYSVPTSLTVSEDNDSVRKAILESRERARQNTRASQDALLHDSQDQIPGHSQDESKSPTPIEISDAMDIG